MLEVTKLILKHFGHYWILNSLDRILSPHYAQTNSLFLKLLLLVNSINYNIDLSMFIFYYYFIFFLLHLFFIIIIFCITGCPKGKFFNGSGCAFCPADEYQPLSGQANCSVCQSGPGAQWKRPSLDKTVCQGHFSFFK